MLLWEVDSEERGAVGALKEVVRWSGRNREGSKFVFSRCMIVGTVDRVPSR